MGFVISRWLRQQPLGVQCIVFGLFGLIGGLFLRVGLVTGDRRAIYTGVTLAVAWPLDTFVVARIEMRIREWLSS